MESLQESQSTVPSLWTLGAALVERTLLSTSLSTSSSTLQSAVPTVGSRKSFSSFFPMILSTNPLFPHRSHIGMHANLFLLTAMQLATNPGLTAARPLCVTFGSPITLGFPRGVLSKIAV